MPSCTHSDWTQVIGHKNTGHRSNWTHYDWAHDSIGCTGPIGHRNIGYTGVWETVALVASPARLHSNALDTFRSSCSHHY